MLVDYVLGSQKKDGESNIPVEYAISFLVDVSFCVNAAFQLQAIGLHLTMQDDVSRELEILEHKTSISLGSQQG